MALAVGAGGRANTERVVVRLVEWLQRHEEPISEQLWEELVRISRQNQDMRAKMHACRALADRIDPIPRAPVLEVHTGPVTITWEPSSSPTRLGPTSRPFTTTSNGITPELPASSATDALENL